MSEAKQGRRRPGRLNPTVGKARKIFRDALAAAGSPRSVLVACSGGPDSLALASVAAFFARRAGSTLRIGAVIVDHQLQAGSDEVAARTAATLRDLGLDPVVVIPVTVNSQGNGPEAAAREARLAALESAAVEHGAQAVLLGHTLDDQAEQVLLGLARGSGTRSLAGMPARRDFGEDPNRGFYLRPFLPLRRAEIMEICDAEGLDPWHDPTNADAAFARSRVRTTVMPMLEHQLGPGVAESLYRSASILSQDAQYLAEQAQSSFAALRQDGPEGEIFLSETALRELPAALRIRVLALAVEALGGAASYGRLHAAEALLERQGSAGPVQLPGGVSAYRQPRPKNASAKDPRYGKLVIKRTD
ncbi:tRNA lysidine(34) synthetase TilS [Pseudarthrobacter sp. J1763]|uniref:tRNA lysidine(34) synthetase TilS n=1 Tax=Pseudarthrobacter sp. J1763 TaxID=3420445 RepID=UPI003D2D5FC2